MAKLDPALIAEQFPVLHQEVNGKPLRYLDNAATTQRPLCVMEAMNAFYRTDNANVHRGVHRLSQRATDSFESARKLIQNHIGANHPEEIIFTKGCTEALNLVASSWGRMALKAGDRILVSTMEHHANIVPWQMAAEAAGAKVEPIPITDDGEIDLDGYRTLLSRGGCRMVAVKHACNALGTVNPIQEMAREAHQAGALICVDGAQGLAHGHVDVKALGADFYSMASHKTYGPMGVGAVYGRRDLLEAMPPYQGGGDMIRTVSFEGTTYNDLPNKFEAGTPNVAGVIGFAAAVEWLQALGLENVAEAEQELLGPALEEIAALPGVTVVGKAKSRTGIISFTVEGIHPHDLGTILDQEGVAVRTGHHCCMPLMRRLGLPATVRASLGVYNQKVDIHVLIGAIKKAKAIFA